MTEQEIAWDTFWIDLLREYEAVCADLTGEVVVDDPKDEDEREAPYEREEEG